MNDETVVLFRVLDSQRNHIFHALEGLADADLRRPVLPSTWTCLGLVRHLTLADERYWFRCVVGGESTSYFPTDPGGDWAVGADESAAAVLDAYRAEIALANELIRSTPIDASPRWRDPGGRSGAVTSRASGRPAPHDRGDRHARWPSRCRSRADRRTTVGRRLRIRRALPTPCVGCARRFGVRAVRGLQSPGWWCTISSIQVTLVGGSVIPPLASASPSRLSMNRA